MFIAEIFNVLKMEKNKKILQGPFNYITVHPADKTVQL